MKKNPVDVRLVQQVLRKRNKKSEIVKILDWLLTIIYRCRKRQVWSKAVPIYNSR